MLTGSKCKICTAASFPRFDGLTLNLFMAFVFRAYNHNFAFSFYNLAFIAHRFNRWSYFHFFISFGKNILRLVFASPDYSAFGQIVRTHFEFHAVAEYYLYVMLAKFPRNVRRNYMPVRKFYLKHRVGQYVHDYAFCFDYVVF